MMGRPRIHPLSADGETLVGMTARLHHPMLQSGEILMRRPRGESRWMLLTCTWPNGIAKDALEVLRDLDLEILSHTADVPKIVRKDE